MFDVFDDRPNRHFNDVVIACWTMHFLIQTTTTILSNDQSVKT